MSGTNADHSNGTTQTTWTPSSWRSLPIKQQPKYADQNALESALNKVRSLPPLVHSKEIEALKKHIADAQAGRKFFIQGGDCAERFVDCSQTPIENKFKILLQMSLIVLWGARVPVIRVARMAGQFAKPRSSDTEVVNGKTVVSFKGDNVNDFDVNRREPDPDRLVQAYFHSAATINYIRAMILGGVADLHHPRSWNLDFVQQKSTRQEYEHIIERITEGLDFFSSIHADQLDTLRSVEMYTSHEALLLNYEESLTKGVKDQYYNLGSHFLWIGDRTRDIKGAHIEYFRGISNPIGVKVGPSMKPDELAELITILNPNKEPGKITLITRYGCNNVEKILPDHIRAVTQTGIPVLWVCDPCHGNTEVTSEGLRPETLRT